MNATTLLNFHLAAPPKLRTTAAPAILAALEINGAPMTAQQLADAIGYRYNGARQLTAALAAEGFLTVSKDDRTGKPRGNTPLMYSLKEAA